MRRPHYAYRGPGGGWGPDRKNSWVDVRGTENLYLMRVTSVYLFAEATGNREVTRQYKEELRRYARTLYRVSMGGWDSENYHGHSIGPLCNPYDFARDDDGTVFDRSIDVQVMRLRRKIEPNPKKPALIKTARTAGYVFVPPVQWD